MEQNAIEFEESLALSGYAATGTRGSEALQAMGEMSTAEDLADAVIVGLTRPRRADVVEMQIRPHSQGI